MRPDIIGLREFYGTVLGRWVRARLARLILSHWTDTRDDAILGLGYATPILRFFLRQSGPHAPIVAAMPRGQGALYWPSHGDNRSFMSHKQQLPLADNTIHRALLMHALEFAEDPAELLRELWRVLTPGGRAMICVPNRRSMWSSAQRTPFGHGTPYSVAQLRQLTEKSGFTLMQYDTIIFTPPLHWDLLQKLAGGFEWMKWILPRAGGIVVMEVEKQIYASLGEPVDKKATNVVWVPAVPA